MQSITDEKEIIRRVKEYVGKRKWVDINSFIWNDMNYPTAPDTFVQTIGEMMASTGKYLLDKQEGTKYWVVRVVPKKDFKDRFWWVIAIIGWFIGLLTPMITEYIKEYPQKSTQSKPSTVQKPSDSRHSNSGKDSLYRVKP